jgi:hypothetical protein
MWFSMYRAVCWRARAVVLAASFHREWDWIGLAAYRDDDSFYEEAGVTFPMGEQDSSE